MTVTELTDLKTTINWLLENGNFKDKETSYNIAMNSINILEEQLSIPRVSHRTFLNKQMRIEPIYDGKGTAVETYKVVDSKRTIWMQGNRQECENYLYGG